MKKLFLTTTILTLSSMGLTANATINSNEALSEADVTYVYNALKVSSVAVGLHNGDFQTFAKSVNQHNLFDGTGSSLMATTRRFRY